MAEDVKAGDRKVLPRFSQFALAASRDTSAFETPAVSPDRAHPAEVPQVRPEEAPSVERTAAGVASDAPAPASASTKRERAHRPSPPPPEPADDELISFTVRLPASLYMRMRRSLGLREKLGELCVAAITRELDLRR